MYYTAAYDPASLPNGTQFVMTCEPALDRLFADHGSDVDMEFPETDGLCPDVYEVVTKFGLDYCSHVHFFDDKMFRPKNLVAFSDPVATTEERGIAPVESSSLMQFLCWPQLISYDPDLGCAELMRKRIDRYSRRGFRLCFFERPAERTEAVWARKILDLSPPLKPVSGYEKSTRFALSSPSIRCVFLRQIRDLFRTVSLHRRTRTK